MSKNDWAIKDLGIAGLIVILGFALLAGSIVSARRNGFHPSVRNRNVGFRPDRPLPWFVLPSNPFAYTPTAACVSRGGGACSGWAFLERPPHRLQ